MKSSHILKFAHPPSQSTLSSFVDAITAGCVESYTIFSVNNNRGINISSVPSTGITVQAVCISPDSRQKDIIADPRVKFENFNANGFTIPFSIMNSGDGDAIIHSAMSYVFDRPYKEAMPPIRKSYLDYSTLGVLRL